MQAADAFWHVANFFAPAIVLGGLAAFISRLVWRHELKASPMLRLWSWAAGAAALTSTIGLLVQGRDGKVLTYGAMVVAAACGLWWAGFRKR